MADADQKKRGQKVKEAEIESKDQRWHSRHRVSLVFGSNDIEDLETYVYTKSGIEFKTVKFHQAKSKAIEEILDNCIDEFYRGHVTRIDTTLAKDGKTVTVKDNGIGFALDKIQVVYTEFRTGSKFKDEELDEKGFLHRTLGQNGLGASATCLTSDLFRATVKHYNTKKEQTYTFIDGALQVEKSKVKSFTGESGVTVEIVLSNEVYKDNIINEELLRKRIIDLAFNNPGLTFTFNGEKYLFKKGLFELSERINAKSAQLLGEDHFVFKGTNDKGKNYKSRYDLIVALNIDMRSEERERMISFVNSTPTYDGGFHHDRIKRLYINHIKDRLERMCKKEKLTLVDNDILAGVTFTIGIIMPNPRFESQTKRKLVRDVELEKAIEEFMEKSMKTFAKNNEKYFELVIERARARVRFSELKDAHKLGKKQRRERVEKLLDANERRDRSNCTLFICEGDSAIGGLRSARNKLSQGGIALKGKPMNVSQASIKEVIENQEFLDIMSSIGLVIGQTSDPANMRYSKIVFLSDSDVDGGHINTLLTNFFYTYWPELFERGSIQYAKAPLFEVITNKGTIYCETPGELESLKKKKEVQIKEIQRNKGLGEMSPEAFKYVLSREEYTKITAKNVGEAKKMLEICFGTDTQLRKDLLIDEEKKTESKSKPAKNERRAPKKK
ncbi:MAG: ATP-binding protein [Bacteriovoracaceae bacterium]|nr:ATP-binding protein [Bacteriovoracaceae bacterium]